MQSNPSATAAARQVAQIDFTILNQSFIDSPRLAVAGRSGRSTLLSPAENCDDLLASFSTETEKRGLSP